MKQIKLTLAIILMPAIVLSKPATETHVCVFGSYVPGINAKEIIRELGVCPSKEEFEKKGLINLVESCFLEKNNSIFLSKDEFKIENLVWAEREGECHYRGHVVPIETDGGQKATESLFNVVAINQELENETIVRQKRANSYLEKKWLIDFICPIERQQYYEDISGGDGNVVSASVYKEVYGLIDPILNNSGMGSVIRQVFAEDTPRNLCIREILESVRYVYFIY